MKTLDKKNTLKGNFNSLIKAYPMLKDNLPQEILEQDYVLSAQEDFKGEAMSLSPSQQSGLKMSTNGAEAFYNDGLSDIYKIVPMPASLLKTSTISYLLNKKRI